MRRGWRGLAVATCLGVSVFAAYACWVGQDANWDLQNYHLYAPYALLHGRYGLDVGPGGFQAYLNPLPYVLLSLARAQLPPLAAGMLVAGLQGLLVPVAWVVAGRLPSLARHAGLRALATLIGCTSATAISEIGTSFADLQLAALVLGSLAALLFAGRERPRWLLLAGGLIGAATGLKLTNGIYAAGLAAALLLPWRGWPGLGRAAAWSAAGVVMGFALTGGIWSLWLWRSFGNPIFPGLNSVFRSSSAAFSDFTDTRFLPAGLGQAVAYPWLIATGAHPSAEIAFADARLAIGVPLVLLAMLAAWLRPGAPSDAGGIVRAGAFLCGSYVAWLRLFAIERYAVGLEVVAGIVLIAAAAMLASRVARLVVCMGLAALMLATTRPADWWHRPWSAPYQARPPAAMLQPAAFLVVSHPTGYWVPALPAASRFYTVVPMGLATGGVLRDRMVRGLADPPGDRVWTLGADMPMDAAVRASMAGFGYVPAAPCLRAESLWFVDTVFCRAVRSGERRLAAADLVAGQRVDFGHGGAGWIYEVAGFVNAGADGTATAGAVARLAVHQDAPSGRLEIGLSGTAAGPEIAVSVNGQQAGRWRAESGPFTRAVCLATGVDGVADIVLATDGGQPLGLTVQSLQLSPGGPDCVGNNLRPGG